MKWILLIILSLPQFTNGQIITSFAGNGISGYSGDGGAATSAQFHSPVFVKINDSGYLFISDMGNNVIRKISPSGIISTFAGTGSAGFSGDGAAATSAKLNSPAGVAFDRYGNTFIADWANQRIRKVNSLGVITSVAGTGSAGYSGDGGPATSAKLHMPTNLTFDTSGNLYIADHYNNVVRKVDLSGTISTVAGTGFDAGLGTGSYSGDGGPATAANFYFPFDVAFDVSGNLCIADMGNVRIRKVNPSGVVSTIAGNGVHGYTGDGVAATSSALWAPTSIAFDKSGNMFIADDDNYRIRKVNTLGLISTVAGNGTSGLIGNGGPATAAELSYPEGVALDSCDNLFIADVSYQMIRKVTFDTACGHDVSSLSVYSAALTTSSLYPNPATSEITIIESDAITSISITNLLGQVVYNYQHNVNKVHVDVTDLPVGVYLVRINGTEVRKFVKQ